MATASSIFKIRAIADFLAPRATDGSGSTLLSFRQSQAFYVLSTDKRKGLYFVSTQYATPFARTAVSGLVPMSHFELVDLLSKDPGCSAAQARAKAAAAAAAASQQQQQQAAVVAPAAEPLPAASTSTAAAAGASRPKENITKRLYSYLHSNVRRHSEGALLAPPELRPGEEDHQERRRAGTIPRNVTPAQPQPRSMPAQAAANNSSSSSSNNLRRSPTSMLMATPAAQQQHSVDPAARVTDIEVIAVAAPPSSSTTTASFAIRVTRCNAPTTIVTRTYDDFTLLATSLLQTFAATNDDNDDRSALPALPPPPPSSSLTPSLAEQLRRRLGSYVRHLRHGTPASVGDCAAVCEFLAPRNAHEAMEQRPRKDSGFSSIPTSTTKTNNASVVDGMAVDMESKLNIMSPRPYRRAAAVTSDEETGGADFDFAEDFYQAYV
ncbi:hypothetical protein HDU89_008190 [Geranomyces variabilis]|nr:hypothetical protein HDU89_008190 [Geranomyces variabilis]